MWSPATRAATRTLVDRTGLILDLVWPRIELVLPSEVRRRIRRLERSVAGLRVAAVSALLTGLIWIAGTAVQVITAGPATAAGLLVVAVVLLMSARRRMAELYERRAEAVEIYRFDLARSMHVPIPEDPGEFARLAPVLMGAMPAIRLVESHPGPQTAPARAEVHIDTSGGLSTEALDDLRRAIVREMNSTMTLQLRKLQVQLDSLAEQSRAQPGMQPRVRQPQLTTEHLRILALQVASQLRPEHDRLRDELYQHIGQAVTDAIESAVAGPALVDFTGFMVIDVRQGVAPPMAQPGHVITAPVGSMLEMAFFIVQDDRAHGAAPTMESGDRFWVVEPINLEGGRSASRVEFEAVADSPTLQTRPNRRSLAVIGDAAAEALFSFLLPSEPGRHEVWFQLYQGGRLIQAVAVTVEVTAAQAPVEE